MKQIEKMAHWQDKEIDIFDLGTVLPKKGRKGLTTPCCQPSLKQSGSKTMCQGWHYGCTYVHDVGLIARNNIGVKGLQCLAQLELPRLTHLLLG